MGKKLDWDQLQALQETENGHLLVMYLQQERLLDDRSLPSLYLAEFDAQGKLIRDIPVIAGENQDRAYLENRGDVADALNVQIAFLSKTNELLVSVENNTLQQEYQIMLEEKEAVQRGNRYYFPRMYKIKLD